MGESQVLCLQVLTHRFWRQHANKAEICCKTWPNCGVFRLRRKGFLCGRARLNTVSRPWVGRLFIHWEIRRTGI